MRYEMMFFGSCGHVTIDEVPKETFDRFTTQPGYSALFKLPPNRFRVGKTRSRVYVYPGRYCACADCIKADLESDL